jgi:hypothetical protein
MKRFILYILTGFLTVLSVSAESQFRTSELQRLATVLSLNTSLLPEGYSHPEAKGLVLSVHLNGNTIDHIGLQIFADDIRLIGDSPIFDFLERYFLQLKYPPTVKTATHMLRDDSFRFVTGSIATIDQLLITDDFSFQYDNHHYTAVWKRDGQDLLTVSFPVEYELISGENKIEAEENLMTDIMKASVKDQPDNIQQNSSYISDDFTNRLYFQKGQLVFNNRHLAETSANMMLSTNTKGNFSLNMAQISYGFKKKVFQVPLRQWISFCQKTGCELYFGVDNIDAKSGVSAVVLAVNKAENYNHVLTVTIPTELFDSCQGVIEARLYPYVPMHNVKNMFANYRKSNPKNIVSR